MLKPRLLKKLVVGSSIYTGKPGTISSPSGLTTLDISISSKIQIHQGKPKGRWIPVTITVVDAERVIHMQRIMFVIGTEIVLKCTRDE